MAREMFRPAGWVVGKWFMDRRGLADYPNRKSLNKMASDPFTSEVQS